MSERVERITIEGFRGVRGKFALELSGKSLVLQGANGHGKSTLVDAIEAWSLGSLEAFRRELCGLEAAIHVDADEARIAVEGTSRPATVRTIMRPRGHNELRDELGQTAGPPSPVPVLRHSTMASFMLRSGGDKRKELLELFGLEELSGYRTTLAKASRLQDKAAREAALDARQEDAALRARLDGLSLVERARRLLASAGRSLAVEGPKDVMALDFDKLPAPRNHLAPAAAVDQLVRAVAGLGDDPAADYLTAISNGHAVRADALHAALTASQDVLAHWTEQSCPVCLQSVERTALSEQLAERVSEVAEARRRLAEASESIDQRTSAARSIASAFDRLLATPPQDGWPEPATLHALSQRWRSYAGELAAARKHRTEAPACPGAVTSQQLDDLAAAAAPGQAADAEQALVALVGLVEQARRVQRAEQRRDLLEMVAERFRMALKLTVASVEQAIQEAIDSISELAADYYQRLVPHTHYSDVRLEHDQRRSGQVEFHLLFDLRHPVSPPQRVMSESQLNALGLALMLARVKRHESTWRTLILDDVVNAFDADHRQGLARLLRTEFADWQLIVLTHDETFFDLLRGQLPQATTLARKLVGWTPAAGPVLGDGDPLGRLEEMLASGASAAEMGGPARRALEEVLQTPLRRLGFSARYDPDGLAANDLLDALRSGLKNKLKWTNEQLVPLDDLKGSAFMTNFGVHKKLAGVTPSASDVRLLVSDLRALAEALRCDRCGKPIWTDVNRDTGRHACRDAMPALIETTRREAADLQQSAGPPLLDPSRLPREKPGSLREELDELQADATTDHEHQHAD